MNKMAARRVLDKHFPAAAKVEVMSRNLPRAKEVLPGTTHMTSSLGYEYVASRSG